LESTILETIFLAEGFPSFSLPFFWLFFSWLLGALSFFCIVCLGSFRSLHLSFFSFPFGFAVWNRGGVLV
jgi:hypothetical protein